MTIVYFIIALGFLIFFHELGHFLLAKRAGVRVEVFSLGFGPRLFGMKLGETDYRVSLVPLGGYVKMFGEEAGEKEEKTDPRSFAAKGVWARTQIILFGPLANFVLCILIMPIVFMIGRAQPAFLDQPPEVMEVKAESPAARAGLEKGDLIVSVDGKRVGDWEGVVNRILLSPGRELRFGIKRGEEMITADVAVEELPEVKGGFVGIEPMLMFGREPQVDEVKPGGPAATAGVQAGDLVVAFDGKPVDDWLELTKLVNESKGKAASIVVQRGEERVPLEVTAAYDDDFGRWLIGISKDRSSGMPMTVKRYGFVASIGRGMQEIGKLTMMTFSVLKKLITLQLSYKVLGGPIVIAKTSAAAAASGISSFLYFLAFLSLQLSILNLLPIPVLDGGQLLFLGCEAVLRRPLSLRVRQVAHQVGFVLLISLMFLVTLNDIERVWGLGSLIKKLF